MIFSFFIINRAGGLIYHLDHNTQNVEIEKTFGYPIDFDLREFDGKITVNFGERDGIKVGFIVLAVNGVQVNGTSLDNGTPVLDFIADKNNFPLAIKFGRNMMSTNEKIMLSGMFHSMFAITVQLSPVRGSSGISVLETDTFKLHCLQSHTGVKFVVVADPAQQNCETMLRRLYEVYSDYALKNPFYSLDMPIRFPLFEQNVHAVIESIEKLPITN